MSYNVLNQASSFTQGSKRILCIYDYLNRRIEKALYEGDSLIYRKRFIYRGDLQIAKLDASIENAIPRKTYLWDPSETNATRVLVMSLFDATGSYEDLYYTHDAQKNTKALFGIKAGRRALYQYGAYGNLIKIDGEIASHNPFRFSSEYHDDELALIYYNYRYLNPKDGRWINRDPIHEQGGINLYRFIENNPSCNIDMLGQERSYTYTVNPTPQPRPMPSSAPSALPALFELWAIARVLLANKLADEQNKCLNACKDYTEKHKIKAGCSCCFCLYLFDVKQWGQIGINDFRLAHVQIVVRVKCSSLEGVDSMISPITLWGARLTQLNPNMGLKSESFSI